MRNKLMLLLPIIPKLHDYLMTLESGFHTPTETSSSAAWSLRLREREAEELKVWDDTQKKNLIISNCRFDFGIYSVHTVVSRQERQVTSLPPPPFFLSSFCSCLYDKCESAGFYAHKLDLQLSCIELKHWAFDCRSLAVERSILNGLGLGK